MSNYSFYPPPPSLVITEAPIMCTPVLINPCALDQKTAAKLSQNYHYRLLKLNMPSASCKLQMMLSAWKCISLLSHNQEKKLTKFSVPENRLISFIRRPSNFRLLKIGGYTQYLKDNNILYTQFFGGYAQHF